MAISSRSRAVLMLAAAASVGACTSVRMDDLGDKPYPGWFQQRVAAGKEAGYPDLAAIPQAAKAGKSAADWDRVGRELDGAGAALAEDPRSAPAALGDLAAFEAEARAAATPPPLAPGAGAARATPPAVPPPAAPVQP